MAGNSFTYSCGEWRNGTYENFKKWAVKQFGLKNLDSDEEADIPVHMQKAKDISFKRNKKGIYNCLIQVISKLSARGRELLGVTSELFIIRVLINH
jgi:hypothetical protein